RGGVNAHRANRHLAHVGDPVRGRASHVDRVGLGDHRGCPPNKCMASAPPAARHLSQVAVARPLASHGRLIAGVPVAGVLVRLLFAGLVPHFGDEAYYWEWSRHLAPGYFDHPPGIPLLIRGGTALLGNVPLGVLLLPVLAVLLAALATSAVARRLAGDQPSLRAALITPCMPPAAARP